MTCYFAENLTDNTGTPEWWLAAYGFTNYTADAEVDTDGDGLPNWQEYIADTIPTNSLSRLALGMRVNAESLQLDWIGGTSAIQYLECRTNLLYSDGWFTLYTNMPPTSVTNQISLEGGSEGYYRIRVLR